MPITKNILTRIEILDELLNSPQKRTINDLLKAVNKRLKQLDYEEVSKKTLQNDLSYLQRKGAPVKRGSKKDPFIFYEESFSIKNVPISEEDISYLKKAIHILKKATDLNIINDVEEIVSRLENKIHTSVPAGATIIAFEQHTQAIGEEHIDNLFTAIQSKCSLKIAYQPFGKPLEAIIIHPYMLKEYRNRWFLLGQREGFASISVYALDRIKKVSNCKTEFKENPSFDPDKYFSNLIGVSLPNNSKVEEIVINVRKNAADYILTKPIHKTQEVVKEYADKSLRIRLFLHINYELKSTLLSYGPDIEVLAPASLRSLMQQSYAEGAKMYAQADTSIS
jgi:predicted DNA-binding transcriptional regulator YafY